MLQRSAQIASTQSLPPKMWARFQFLGKSAVAPCRLALLLTKAGDVESNPGRTTHTNKHTTVIWICDSCHKQINKKQPSIRCNHTRNTHWIHLKYTQIKQRQYKPGWGCIIHTHTHTKRNNNTKHSPSQTNYHEPTHRQQSTKGQRHRHTSNQNERNQKQNRGTKKPRTQHPTGHHHNTRNKLTHKAKHKKYPTTPPNAQTESTNNERGGGLNTLIKDDITFTNINIPKAINTHNTEYN